MIYLDNAATTKVEPRVLKETLPYLMDEYGNAGGLYELGRHAAEAIDKARAQVANLFGCTPEHIIFTSGGSESNNMVFKSLAEKARKKGKNHVIISAVEHESVIKAAKSLLKHGFYITYVYPDSTGRIDVKAVNELINEHTVLVSVMFANNEVGTVNDIFEIGKLCKEKKILFHTDCVQAAGQYPIEVDKNFIDFASVSAHKIHGLKGVGALYVRDKTRLAPLISGGEKQEFGLRGGTENVYGVVAFGTACEVAVENMKKNQVSVSIAKQTFYSKLIENFEQHSPALKERVYINGASVTSSSKVLNLRFDGIDGESLVLLLDVHGVCASSGSACNSHESLPSHVLSAMGIPAEQIRSSVRFSFSKFNTPDEMVEAARIVAECVGVLSCSWDEI